MKGDEYQCALCGGVFTKALDEDEAMAETHEYWPNAQPDDCDLVCDDCWEQIRPDRVLQWPKVEP